MYKWSVLQNTQCSAYVARLLHQSQIALEGEYTSVCFVCSELYFQQMVLSKQETGCFGVETCCVVEGLERRFDFCARTLLSF